MSKSATGTIKAIETARPLPAMPPSPYSDPFAADAARARRDAIVNLEIWFTRVVREKLSGDSKKEARIHFREAARLAFSWILAQDGDFWRQHALLAKAPRDLFRFTFERCEFTRAEIDAVANLAKGWNA